MAASDDSTKANDDAIEISPELEKELCLAINRELHVSYCYLVMSGIFTRQGLKSFSGMCTRQEDYHRCVESLTIYSPMICRVHH